MKRVAFLSFDWDYEISSELYRGIATYAATHEDLQTVIFSAFGHYHKKHEADVGTFKVFDLCDLARFDGLIVQGNRTWAPDLRQQLVDRACELGMPVVSVNYDLANACTVGTDNYEAMHGLITKVFEDHACTRPLFINGYAPSVEAQDRLRAYVNACAEHAVEPRVIQGSWQIEAGRSVAEQLVQSADALPDVIFCCNDDLAVGVEETLLKHGVRVPEDVLITGFDNREISYGIVPHITTVARDYAATGYAAMRTISRLLAGAEMPRRVFCPAQYLLRESSGYTEQSHAGDEGDLITLDGALKRFYEVLNDFQAGVFGADSLKNALHACEEFAPNLHCPCAYVTINDAYLHAERTQDADTYHVISHLMGFFGDGERPACSEHHIYRSFVSRDILPPDIMGQNRLYVVYPLHHDGACIGTLVTEDLSPSMRHGFLTICLTLMSAGITSVHNMELLRLANSRLDDLYVHDELTRLFNRFGLDRFGVIAYNHLLRDFGKAHFIFVDIDNMKRINDTLGHAQGDCALRDTADVIRRATLGENAFAMRYGGDEFLLVSRFNLISRLEQELRLLKNGVRRPYDLQLSMGTVEIRAEEHLSIEEAIRKADDKMYEIKRRQYSA